jgi:hypothetical protein
MSIGSRAILIERHKVERGKDIVSEDRLYDINKRTVKNIVNCDHRDSWIIFGEIPGAFLNERSGNGTASPAMLGSKRIRLILKILADELLQTHINFPRFIPICPDFLEQLSHSAPIY